MQEKNSDCAKRGRAFTKATFRRSFIATAKEEAREKNENAYAIREPAPSTLRKYRRKIAGHRIKNPNKQNIKREQVSRTTKKYSHTLIN